MQDRNSRIGALALASWVLGQAAWLGFGFQLEFLGMSSWLGLWGTSALFFSINCWLLGIIVQDGGRLVKTKLEELSAAKKETRDQESIAR